MKVILLKDLKGKGKLGDIIETNEGYARNFLFPNGIAKEANGNTINAVNIKKSAQAHKKDVEKQEAQSLADKIKELEITVTGKGGAGGKLFGSITNKEISEALMDQHKIEIDKKKITVPSSIKGAGTFEATVKVYAEISAPLTFHVKIVEE